MAGEIVVGVGPDHSGEDAARYGCALAALFGTSVVLVFGYDQSALGPRGGPLEEQLEEIAADITAEVVAVLAVEHPNVEVRVELVRDRPADSLLRVAESIGAEMIVVGHGGGGPIRAALLGSTTYELVHRGSIPIVVIPAKE
jgi:nucleotide-binding universal stress UspA family protein